VRGITDSMWEAEAGIGAELIRVASRNHWRRLLAYHRARNRNSAVTEGTPPSSSTAAVFLLCGIRNRTK
jgi:hypothetical protein